MNSRKQLQIKKGVYAQAYSIRKCECSHFFLLLDSLISFGIIIVIGILIFDLPFSILTGGMIVCIILCCASCMSIGFLLGSFGIILPDINFVYNLFITLLFFSMWCQSIHSSAATPPAVACLCSAIDTWAAGNAAAYPWNMEYAGHFSDAAGGALYGDLCWRCLPDVSNPGACSHAKGNH